MIVVFTSVENGGIAQFTVKVLEVLSELGYECVCFMPSSRHIYIPEKYKNNIESYNRFKVLSSRSKAIIELKNRIMALNPNAIFYCDNAVISDQICNSISGIKQWLTIHDVNFHPSYNLSLKRYLHDIFNSICTSKAIKKASRIVLLSPYSKTLFDSKYKFAKKSVLLNLGAHIPNCNSQPLSELADVSDYFMFFGRIDRYKGLYTLLKAYNAYKYSGHKLVIAGSGVLTDEEKDLVSNNKNIILINRFIEDEEMIYLFKNARSLILPYIEASQSGIIPIAYRFGIPVIVSAVKGLTQYVDDRGTGIICNSESDYTEAMEIIESDSLLAQYKENCVTYYSKVFDWNKNFIRLFEDSNL